MPNQLFHLYCAKRVKLFQFRKDGLHARKSQELNTRQNTSNKIMKEHKVLFIKISINLNFSLYLEDENNSNTLIILENSENFINLTIILKLIDSKKTLRKASYSRNRAIRHIFIRNLLYIIKSEIKF
ncbi:hypothetical protein BpHYR1_014921 [Brachionus plicatilis]|uniref:Uncharacterized protein n=1 Tax=Brachionus plicatilis TaxID=10195 RepID=A0A3M7Q6L9_BRAPC|nr:hypothetical protein BpHYR1_014921 [Brachionus plicatilis]